MPNHAGGSGATTDQLRLTYLDSYTIYPNSDSAHKHQSRQRRQSGATQAYGLSLRGERGIMPLDSYTISDEQVELPFDHG